jgi:DNA-binding MarR family transcriptional regulator
MPSSSRESPHHSTDQEQALGEFGMVVQDLARTLSSLNMHHDPLIIRLSPVESMVMDKIDATPGITPGEIAASLDLRSSNAAAALRTLEAKGFFTRVSDPHDRRVSHLHATSVAQENLARVKRAWAQALSPAFPDDADPCTVVAQLTSLRDELRRAGH